MKVFFKRFALFLILNFLFSYSVKSFGVLTHEAIVDASWDKSIVPLLKSKYPNATPDELKEAHAYAYGGAVTPDMGYYPFSSKLFTNLIHYVRSGDMVMALLKDADNLNQYAFALGFLSHYYADNYGHPLATNRSVPLVYRKMKRKFGAVVTYADNKISHMRMEFGFDVLEVAKGNYASQSYHNFIGFKVDTTVLAKAFLETYGLQIDAVFHRHFQMGVETFRWMVANVFPNITKVAWASRKNSILKQNPTATSRNFKYIMKQKEYNKQYGKGYKSPGILSTSISFLIKFMPKIGPTRALKFKAPTTTAEKYFDQSFDTILITYGANLKRLKTQTTGLKDKDFDTGLPTAHCEYSLADDTYFQWLQSLGKQNFTNVDNAIQADIINYFGFDKMQLNNNHQPRKCKKFYSSLQDLERLKIPAAH